MGSISLDQLNKTPPPAPREPVYANGRTGAPPGEPARFGTPSFFGSWAEWRRDLSIAAATGLFLGLVGPFGTYLNANRVIVIAFWVGAILTGEIVIGLSVRAATLLAARRHLPTLALIAAATAAAAIPLALLCHTVALALWPVLRGRIGLFTFYGQTLVVSFAITAVRNWLTPLRLSAAPAATLPVPGDFLGRIPRHLGRDLIALQMEDHYVRVHTRLGSALILIPLRQALEELGAIPGLQVHRSWWVARHAVVGTEQDGRNVRLRLVNGLAAPVSRARIAAARQAQLFAAG